METTKITIIVDDQLSLLTKFCHLKRLRWSKCRSEHSKWLCFLFVDQFHSYIICRMTIHRSIDRSSSISLFQKSLYSDFEEATFLLSLHFKISSFTYKGTMCKVSKHTVFFRRTHDYSSVRTHFISFIEQVTSSYAYGQSSHRASIILRTLSD